MKKLLLTIVMSAVGISAYASPSPLSEKFVVFKKPDYAQQIVSNHHTVQNVVIKECKGTEWGILNDKLDDQGYICLGWSDFEKWNAHGLVTQGEIIEFSKSIGAVYVTYIATATRNKLATFYNFFFFAYGPDLRPPKSLLTRVLNQLCQIGMKTCIFDCCAKKLIWSLCRDGCGRDLTSI